jgi:hypothetical protein
MSNKGPTDPNSVTNPANWSLSVGGATVANGISAISYDPVAHEATLTFNAGTGTTAVPLGSGNYVLTAEGTIEDSYGNALDGNGAGVNGVNFTRSFSVKIDTPINITAPTGNSPAVASDANGDAVVVWVSYGQNGDAATDGNIYAQLYTKLGQPIGTQILVNSFTTGNHIDPAVAMNAGGTFVVAWSGEAADGSLGISARAFNVSGTPLGDQFLVNQFPNNNQYAPAVAINAAGNVVITWTSYSQSPDTGYNGIWARSFNILQGPPAATNTEFLVNTALAYNHDNSSVAMAANGNFTVVWQSFGQDGSDWGVFGQRFNSADAKLGGEFQVNTYTTDKQMLPKVAMDANGDTVITWESFGQDGSGWGIYARRYSPAGVALDPADVQINQHTLNYQMTPDVGIDGNGNYIITWSTYGQDNTGNPANLGYDIYARQFNANGTDYVDPTTGTAPGEFLVNATVLGDQVTPAIAVDPNHDYAIVWVGPSTTVAGGTAIFGYFNDPAPPTGPTISGVVAAPLANPPVLTWSAADSSGLGAMTLLVDGKAVSTIYGPYGSKTNANFAGLLPTGLAAGTHSYVIQAADTASTPLSSQFSGTFSVPAPSSGPTVGGVVVAPTANPPVITWSASDTTGISKVSLQIDGKAITAIYGPYGTNYAGVLPTLSAGTHTYVIQVSNAASSPVSAQITGTFAVQGSNPGPTISGVVVAPSASVPVLTWSAADPNGLGAMTLTIDGKAISAIYGPYGSSTSANYAGAIGTLGAGTHTYVITATDKATPSASSQSSGSFVVGPVGPTISGIVFAAMNGNGSGIIDSSDKILVTWSLSDASGIASTSISADSGVAPTAMYGPYATSTGVNYAAVFNTLAAGSHTFTITATDNSSAHTASQATQTLTVAQAAAAALAQMASAAAASSTAKTDWLINSDALTASSGTNQQNSADAVDAVLAAS